MKNNIGRKSEEVYWILQYGTPKRKITHQEILANPELIERPVFFLSTGRCGTKWFATVLDLDRTVKANHEPIPTFSMQNNFVYRMWKDERVPLEVKLDTMENIFTAGREQHLRYSYKSEKRYIETNNQLTFFAPGLARMFPDAQFVHLYRHPGEFVRSGMRRGWFDHNEPATLKIIRPQSDAGVPWDSYSQIQKIAWVWKETNLFIERFFQDLEEDQKFLFDFNEKSFGTVRKMVDFLGVDLSDQQIKKKLDVRLNHQTTGEVDRYEDWEEGRKEELRGICGELAERYGDMV